MIWILYCLSLLYLDMTASSLADQALQLEYEGL